MVVTRDNIIGVLANGDAMTSKEIAEDLGTSQLYSVRTALGNLSRFGEVARVSGGRYQSIEAPKAEFSTKSYDMREGILDTEKAAIKNRKEARDGSHKANTAMQPDWPLPLAERPVSLKAEEKVDEIPEWKKAIERLKKKYEPFDDVDKKTEFLAYVAQLDLSFVYLAGEIAKDLRRK